MIYIIFVFFICSSFFGNDFFKINIIGIGPLEILIAMSFIYIIKNFKIFRKMINCKKLQSFKMFVILGIVYIILSYLGFVNLFKIDGLILNRNFIPRQCYFIFGFIIIFSMIISIYKNDKLLIKLKISFVFFSLVVLGINLVYLKGVLSIQTFVFYSVISIYIYFVKNRKIGLLCAVVILLLPLGKYNEETKILIKIILFGYIFLRGYMVKYEVKFFKIGCFVIVPLLFLISTRIIPYLKVNDANAWWRLKFWQHELGILLKSYFVGVGFGTPYATPKLFEHLTDFSVWVSGNYSPQDMVYIIGQHNTFVNIFYRMGLIGGIVFIYFNFCIIKNSFKIKKKLQSVQYNKVLCTDFFFLCSLILIAFNVGLESPAMAMVYFVSAGLNMGLVYKYGIENDI